MQFNLGFSIAMPTSAKWLTEEKRTAMKAIPTTPQCDCKLESHTNNVMEVQGGQHCWALVAMTSKQLSSLETSFIQQLVCTFLECQAGLCDL
jgi:hypothetical protein